MTLRNLFAVGAAVAAIGGATVIAAGPALAQTSAQKTMIDAAKADGVVGEQSDGLLGFHTPSSDSGLQAAVTATNAARRSLYANSAAQAGTSSEVAGARMFETQLMPRITSGQWYRNASGAWVRK
ncbi:YdbL family protein [soil metagenome]